MSRRRKTVELTLRVKVPANWSAQHTRREIKNAWFGEIFAVHPAKRGCLDVSWTTLRPKWVRAEVVEAPLVVTSEGASRG